MSVLAESQAEASQSRLLCRPAEMLWVPGAEMGGAYPPLVRAGRGGGPSRRRDGSEVSSRAPAIKALVVARSSSRSAMCMPPRLGPRAGAGALSAAGVLMSRSHLHVGQNDERSASSWKPPSTGARTPRPSARCTHRCAPPRAGQGALLAACVRRDLTAVRLRGPLRPSACRAARPVTSESS